MNQIIKIYISFILYLQELAKDVKGQGLVEYALILILVAVVVIGALTFVGGKVNTTLYNVGSALP